MTTTPENRSAHIYIRIEPTAHDYLAAIAATDARTLSSLARKILVEWIAKQKGGKK